MGTHKGDNERVNIGLKNGPIGDEPPPSAPVDVKDAVAFWQREVHYYEGRAGEQGASANRLVTIAAGAVAVASIFSTALKEQSLSPLLLTVPAVVCLMWATATRLLHEMELLRAYREHAEWRLRQLSLPESSLASYRSWVELGAAYDMPPVITLTWLFLAGGISVAGTIGVLALLSPMLGPWAVAAWFLLVAIIGALAYTFKSNNRDSKNIREGLGVPDRSEWGKYLGRHSPKSGPRPSGEQRTPKIEGAYGPIVYPRDSPNPEESARPRGH